MLLSLRAAFAQTLCCALLLAGQSPATAAEDSASPAPNAHGTTGLLSNGLTYHIEKGETRGNKISLELVVKAGMLEAPGDPQLSHVVEHIVYEKLADIATEGSVYDRVARMGGARGQDTNAVAGFRETHYFVRVPAGDADALAAGLEIVSDWVRAGKFTDEEIDRGRKTVMAEERGGSPESDAYWNTRRAVWFGGHPQLSFQKAPMTDRDATAAAVRSFHARLYHPANMAVVVSGPVDAEAVVRLLRERFGDKSARPAPPAGIAQPALRGGSYEPDGPALADKPIIEISYLYRVATGGRERARDAAVQLLADRLFTDASAQMSRSSERAIVNGGVQTKPPMNVGSVAGVEVVQGVFTADASRLAEALEQALILFETVARDGFSPADIERSRAALLQSLEAAPVESASERAESWRTYFSDGREEPDRAAIRTALTGLTPAKFNERLRLWLDPRHRDIFINAQRDVVRPDRRAIDSIIERAASSRRSLLAAAEVIAEPVLEPLPGVSIADDPEFARNGPWWSAALPKSGATVLYRKVKGDRVRLYAVRRGGTSSLGPDAVAATAAFDIVNASGLGGIGHAELMRFLARESIEFRPFLSANREGFSASGPADKLLLTLQLARTYLLNPQCDRSELKRGLPEDAPGNGGQSAAGRLDKLIATTLAEVQVDLRRRTIKLDPASLCSLFRESLGTTDDMAIAFEGPLEPPEAFATLSRVLDIAGKHKGRAMALSPGKGTTGRRYEVSSQATSSSNIALVVKRATARTAEGAGGDIAMALVRARLMERLRSQEKGIYTLETSWKQFHDPDYLLISIRFSSLPENADRLIAAAQQELERLRESGASTDEIASARRSMGSFSEPIHLAAEQQLAHGAGSRSHEASDQDVNIWLRTNLRAEIIDAFVEAPAR
jgi:zinc protease